MLAHEGTSTRYALGGDAVVRTDLDLHRLQCIAEALDDLEAIFSDPECFGSSTSIGEYAESLASEFVGRYEDEVVTNRLQHLIQAEIGGEPKLALRHLRHVRRRIAQRWGLDAAKPQFVDPPPPPSRPETSGLDDSTVSPNSAIPTLVVTG